MQPFTNFDEQVKNIYLEARESFYRAHIGHVYILGSNLGFYKIGLTTNLVQRFSNFGVKLPFDVWLENSKVYFDCRWAERYWHLQFHDKRVDGEWFQLDEKDLNFFAHSLGDYQVDVKLMALYENNDWLPWNPVIMADLLKPYASFIPEKRRLLDAYQDAYDRSGGVDHQYIARKLGINLNRKTDPTEFDKPFDLTKPFNPDEHEQ